VRSQRTPIVVKASGLAAGKGVVIVETAEEAIATAQSMFEGQFGSAGTEVVFESGLVEGIGIPAALEKAGWSQAQMLRWAPLMDPPGAPALPASRIVSVLGMADRVTPVGGGLDLVKRWGLPAENLFVERQGHFGAAVKLIRDDSPLRRVQEIVRAL
jgi:hypothetical protein